MKVKAVVAYKGTRFFGWQSQSDGNTVQDHIQKALTTCLREPVNILGASRTDSGVHAERQVFSFETTKEFESEKLRRSANALTPDDISIFDLCPAEESFHPIGSAKAKLYRYSICVSDTVSPFFKDFVWHLPQLNNYLVLEGLENYMGRRNFKSFAAVDGSAKTFERNLFEVLPVLEKSHLHLYFLGEGFLKQMVRNIVGTQVDFWLDKMGNKKLCEVFAAEDRREAGRTAPARGLTLVKIFYEKPPISIAQYLSTLSYFPQQIF